MAAKVKKDKKKMTEAEFLIIQKKKNITFADMMKLDNDFFPRYVIEKGFAEWLVEATDRTETIMRYPRVKKYNPELKKYTYVKDTEAEPTESVEPITAYTLRAAFCKECLKLEKKAPVEKSDWREAMKELAAKAL